MTSWAMRMNPTISGAEAASAVGGPSISEKYEPAPPKAFIETKFDYLIIGGGTAGLTLAARLAEDKGITVGVIETGAARPDDALINTPGLYGQATGKEDYDWAYHTTPQPKLKERSVRLSAGKVLGGSSAINFLVLMRGSASEYDAWSKFGGNQWNWAGLLDFFKKNEKYTAPIWGFDAIFPGITKGEDAIARSRESHFKGYTGPIEHTHNEIYTDALKPCILTLNKLGIKTNRSPDYGNATGIFNIGTSVNRPSGKRSYAASAYLGPSLTKPKVMLLTRITATKIILKKEDDGDVTATGVECVYGDIILPPFTIMAKKVISSAGAYNTPRLLELSGIGNPRIINELGISTVVDLPGVGENLQDHLFVPSDFIAKDGVFTLDALRVNQVYATQQAERYKTTKDGAYATTVSTYGYFKLGQILSANDLAQLRKELDDELKETQQTPLQRAQYEIQKSFLQDKDIGDLEIIMVPHVFATSPPGNDTYYFSFVTAIQHPISRGTVHISSSDPFKAPTINPNYLHSDFDTKCLVLATKFMRKVANTEPLKSFHKGPSTPPASTITDQQFEDYVRSKAVSLQHPIGTAALAPRAMGGVVDSNLLVYGTKNLHIVDMSIAPLHISAHIADTAYAIGQKAYTLITGQQGTAE